MDWLVKKSKKDSVVVKLPQNITDEISINVDVGEKKEACTYHKHGVVTLKEKGVKLLDESPKPGHGGSRIAFLDPASTGDILIELAELPAGH